MKRLLLAGIATAALIASASAADIAKPVYKAPPAAPIHSWTGFYIGGGAGYGAYANVNQDFLAPLTSLHYSTGGKGWLGTLFAGYDYQLSDRWVAGVFADYDFSSIKGVHDSGLMPAAGNLKLTSAWAVGGRIGYLVTPSTMFYAAAGYTEADFNGVSYAHLTTFIPNGTQNGFTSDGWFAGVGAETRLASNWYARLEYRYADYGSQRLTVSPPNPLPVFSTEIEPTVQTVRAGVSYKFGASATANAPVYNAPVAMLAYSWTGFYVGGGVGYGAYTTEDNSLFTSSGAPVTGPSSSAGKGWLGTVIAGYDVQFTDRWVIGIFADYDFTSIKGEHNNLLFAGAGTLKQESAWAVGGRLGYLVTPATLLYATAGYTEADFSGVTYSFLFAPTVVGFQNGATYDGWFVGLGAETQLTANWYARLEYRYADYKPGRTTLFDIAGAPVGFDNSTEQTMQTVRAGLSYKFVTGKAPVVAKY